MNSEQMNFRPLGLSDKATVQRFTLGSHHRNCDLNFMNLTSWRFLFGTELAEWDGKLIFRFTQRGHLAYQAVVADGSWPETLELMAADARRLGHPLLLMGVCRHVVPEIEAAFPGRFKFTPSRDYCDYLYHREALATLAGKKLQPKRNHVNKFVRLYPDYRFAPLLREDIADCLALEQQWAAGRDSEGGMFDQESERRSMRYVFDHWSELDAVGGTLRVDGKLVAFTFGGPVNGDTFDVCVEKADTDYEGAYAVINRDFARSLPERYVYLNREEDLGIEGLRHAKLSYQPVALLEKFSVTELHPFHHALP